MKSPDDLQTRARELYRHASRDIDTATAARLREIRRHALEAGERRPLRWMMPAGAFAVTALAVIVAWQPLSRLSGARHAPVATHAVADNAADLPPDADSADPALYEDLDFYAWVADQPTVAHRSGD